MTNAVDIAQSGTINSSWRNRIINGGMVIDQRNAGASVTPSGVQYTVDRWAAYEDTDGTLTFQQSSIAPAGFTKSIVATTTSADSSLSATQRVIFLQRIEGYNIADLGWGTADAKTVTLSFWVRSSLTGTFGGSLGNVGASNRSYPFTYTINSANTFEYKTVTIAGDTTGTWDSTNGIGIQVCFGLGVGSTYSGTAGAWAGADYNSATGATSVVGTNGATWYLTGVQFEVGSAASPFEYRDYSRELMMCQRYYYRLYPNAVNKYLTTAGTSTNSTTCQSFGVFPVPMRIAPTALEQSGTAGNYSVLEVGLTLTACSVVPVYMADPTTTTTYGVLATVSSGLVTSRFSVLVSNATTGASAYLGWSAEL